MDKVSIIVAIYKVEAFLEQCLSSIQNQTYQNIEVLMIDDGSPDGSSLIAKTFLSDARFFYFKKKNGGLSSARNYGLKKATGKYVSFIDADDYIESDYIETLVREINNANSHLAVCGFYRDYANRQTLGKVSFDDISLFRCPAAWNKLYLLKNIIHDDLKFPEGKWYEDLHFTTRYLLLHDFCFTTKPLYHYRQNGNSIMHTYDSRIFQIYDVIKDVIKFSKDHGVYEDKKSALEFMCIYHVLVGTSFRASFLPDFHVSTLKEIHHFVEDLFPNWYNNKWMKKNLGVSYRVMLFFIHHHLYRTLYFLLKTFHRFVYL